MAKNKVFATHNVVTLPTELVKEILLKLENIKDVIHLLQTTKRLHSIYDDQSFWKILCQKHYPHLSVRDKTQDFRAVFIAEYESRQKLRQFTRNVESILENLNTKLGKTSVSENRLLRATIENLSEQNKKMLTSGDSLLMDYVYLLYGLKEALTDSEYKSEQQRLTELLKKFGIEQTKADVNQDLFFETMDLHKKHRRPRP